VGVQIANGQEKRVRAKVGVPVWNIVSTIVARRSNPVALEGDSMATKITRDIIESYLNCKYKGHLHLAGDSGTPSDYETMTTAQRQVSRGQAVARLVARFGQGDAGWERTATAAVLKQGTPFLADVDLGDEVLSLRCEALKRAEGASKLGDHHYVPVLHGDGWSPDARSSCWPFSGFCSAACRDCGPPRGWLPAVPRSTLRQACPPGPTAWVQAQTPAGHSAELSRDQLKFDSCLRTN
jgi:hypothetical protein